MLKMFILSRRDILSLSQAAVQSCHSCAEFIYQYGHKDSVKQWVTDDRTMILLSATEHEINEIKQKYLEMGLCFRSFKEPDMGDIETSTSFEPIESNTGNKIFGDLQLLR